MCWQRLFRFCDPVRLSIAGRECRGPPACSTLPAPVGWFSRVKDSPGFKAWPWAPSLARALLRPAKFRPRTRQNVRESHARRSMSCLDLRMSAVHLLSSRGERQRKMRIVSLVCLDRCSAILFRTYLSAANRCCRSVADYTHSQSDSGTITSWSGRIDSIEECVNQCKGLNKID